LTSAKPQGHRPLMASRIELRATEDDCNRQNQQSRPCQRAQRAWWSTWTPVTCNCYSSSCFLAVCRSG